ncbi:MAG: hypothetical protein JNK63_03025 [Chthonomonas sp.]|nr:hypothetical protein [Chthonomonas sp.]
MRFSRGSRNFVLGFVALVAAGYGAWQGYAFLQLQNFVLRELPVTEVNLVALDPKAGYRIIVANQIAQVVEQRGEQDETGFSDEELSGGASAEGASRLPVKDLLQALQGDDNALSQFVMSLNKISENDLPPNPVKWRQEDLELAFNGDSALRAQLEKDLNAKLDGTPLDEVRPSSLESGIVVDFPVEVTIKENVHHARVLVEYRTAFAREVMRRLEDRSTITEDTIRGTYLDEAQKILNGTKPKENIVESIRAKFSDARKAELRRAPQRVLGAVTVILNNEQMKSAAIEPYEASNGQRFHNLRVDLNDEGMKRLWKYSRENRGFQVLLTVDGIPVAAPRFRSELISHQVTINQLADARLAQDTADVINHNR